MQHGQCLGTSCLRALPSPSFTRFPSPPPPPFPSVSAPLDFSPLGYASQGGWDKITIKDTSGVSSGASFILDEIELLSPASPGSISL